jgi:L-ribulose-5-phosphate 3-epimerase
MTNRIGFMQGRLSPIVDNKIQSFPWGNWKNEIVEAKQNGLSLMEWTLDQVNLNENPLMMHQGKVEIIKLCDQLDFSIPSLTGDCFMQAPFWKAVNVSEQTQLEKTFLEIAEACSAVGIKKIVVPLVDNGSIQQPEQESVLVDFCTINEVHFRKLGLKIVFESDFPPIKLKKLMDRLESNTFGINYDIGNSAALGFKPEDEFLEIGNRILNVHVKDRVLNGATVPLGEGNADFPEVFKLLRDYGYHSDYILQTARATDENHVSRLLAYKNLILTWIKDSES